MKNIKYKDLPDHYLEEAQNTQSQLAELLTKLAHNVADSTIFMNSLVTVSARFIGVLCAKIHLEKEAIDQFTENFRRGAHSVYERCKKDEELNEDI